MSEQSLGDISHNRIHQMLEALQSGGFPVDLLHRLRLDEKYREAFIEQAQLLDRELIGEKLTINHDPAFNFPGTIIEVLKSLSPYSGRCSYLLKEEILFSLCEADPERRKIAQYPFDLYTMPLYKRMTVAELDAELRRRDLVSAGAIEALCLATHFIVHHYEDRVLVPRAIHDGRMLCFSRTGRGDPMLGLCPEKKRDDFEQGERVLVKRKPA